MKIKPYQLVLVAILCIGGVFAVFFFDADTRGDLFSRGVSPVSDNVDTEGEEPRPVVESLDGQAPDETVVDLDTLIQELEKELVETQNDPDKAFELRRRLQLLKAQKESSTPEEKSPEV